MSEDRQPCIALTTAGSEAQAREIADALVERRLAACVNIVGPICSVYRWKGEVCRDDESLLIIKTTRGRFPQVREAIRELHTYELPEAILVSLDGGDDDYMRWIAESVKPG